MELTARQSNNYSRVSTADTCFSLNWYGHLLIKNVCSKCYFFKASCKGKQHVNQKY